MFAHFVSNKSRAISARVSPKGPTSTLTGLNPSLDLEHQKTASMQTTVSPFHQDRTSEHKSTGHSPPPASSQHQAIAGSQHQIITINDKPQKQNTALGPRRFQKHET
jgi:hypothetical protein